MFKIILPLSEGSLKRTLRRLRLFHPSLHRLSELSRCDANTCAACADEFSEILSDVIIEGVWKRTRRTRLSVLDEWVGPRLLELERSPLTLLDVGASDGITTYDTLLYSEKMLQVELRATVLEKTLALMNYRKGCLDLYLTKDGTPILAQIGIVGISFEETPAVEGLIFNPIVRLAKRHLRQIVMNGSLPYLDSISLKNPAVTQNPHVNWLETSEFSKCAGSAEKYDFIRCSNVLNRGYFKEDEISGAIRNLTRCLKPKGLLLVSREASSGIHMASLWRRDDRIMTHIADLNGGSEIKSLLQND